MIARRSLPQHFVEWNDRWGAPNGRRTRLVRMLDRLSLGRTALALRARGPFAWQPNNTTREFEFPWAYFRIAARAARLGPQTIVDVGGSLAGLQFVLAREGHRVINVDPGLAARGRGWEVSRATFDRLCEVFEAPVELRPTTLAEAGLEDGSVDILLSISTIEHFAEADLEEWARHAPRVLKPDGAVVLTVDLFLDVAPFGRRVANEFGRNVDVRELLDSSRFEVSEGDPAELYGFEQFDAYAIHENLHRYLVGTYPALAQCVVAGHRVAAPRDAGAPPLAGAHSGERERWDGAQRS